MHPSAHSSNPAPRSGVRSRLRTTALATVALGFVLVGCSDDSSVSTGSPSTGSGAVSVENCGIDVSVEGPPERVYAAYQPAIEVAHALGVGDRLIETAYLDSQVLPEYVDAQSEAAYVENLPSRDALLATEPDFVLSGFNGVFASDSPTGFGTRASLADLGVESWILSPLCPSEDGLTDEAIDPATVRVDTIHDDLRELGRIFDVEDRAEEVIAEQAERIAAVEAAVDGAERPTVAFVSLRDDGSISVAGGVDFGTQILEHAGGVNAFADLTGLRNNQIDIEELIRRDPDVILTSRCCDASYVRADAAEEVAAITALPALAGLSAVENDRVHPFLFADRSAGVRAAHSIEVVASILHPDIADLREIVADRAG